jgi:hypothetical protein
MHPRFAMEDIYQVWALSGLHTCCAGKWLPAVFLSCG